MTDDTNFEENEAMGDFEEEEAAEVSRVMKHNTLMAAMREIKLVIFDVDGVLTDGKLYYGADGEVMKVFNVRDGVGIQVMLKNELDVVIMSGHDSPPLRRRLLDLGVKHAWLGVEDKEAAFAEVKKQFDLENKQIMYIGDDIYDAPIMQRVGVSLAPSDAHIFAQKSADAVLAVRGGSGVARVVLDMFAMASNDPGSIDIEEDFIKH